MSENIMHENEFKKRSIKGFYWLTIGSCIRGSIDVITKIVLVRLLLPVDFGIFATAYIFINALRTVKEIGLSTAIIHKKDIDDESLSSVFFFNILLGSLLLAAALITAPLIAVFFKNSSLTLIIRVLSLSVFIESFNYVHNAILIKKLDFKDTVIPGWAGILAHSITGITLAYLNFGIWSLVWSSIARSFATFLLFWKVNPWRPKIRFSYSKFKGLFNFSIKVSGARIITYAKNNIGYIVIAKLLGPVAVGYYFFAYTLSHYCNARISPILNSLVFPVLSKLQDDEQLKRYYLKVVKYSFVIGIPFFLGMLALGRDVVLFINAKKWLQAVLPLQILCILAGLNFIENSTVRPLFLTKGEVDKLLQISILTFAINTIAAFAGLPYGIMGVATAITLAGLLNFLIIIYTTNPIINISWSEYAANILPICLSGGIMLIFLLLFNILGYQGPVFLSIKIILASVIYLSALLLWKINILQEIQLIHKAGMS